MDLIYQRCLTFYEVDSPKAFTLLPDSPGAAPKLLSLLSSTLSGLAQFFSHLLRRPPREAPQRRPDFSLLLPALPVTGLSQRHEQRSGRLSLLLGAALALPGRPPRGRLPREEDASAGQSSPMPVSTVVSTTPHPRPHSDASISCSFLTPTDPLHTGLAGTSQQKGEGGGKVETVMNVFKEKAPAARLAPARRRRPSKLLFPGPFPSMVNGSGKSPSPS
uniref:Uncharacterized protein n=1 Tax=Equus asinus asinus TaxID=83772 RepID=A0A8C4MRC3_EQUAS